MSDQVVRPEQTPETTSTADVQQLDAKVGDAQTANPTSSAETPPASDNTGLKNELPEKAVSPAVEADNRIAKAQDVSTAKPIEVNNFEKSGVMTNSDVQGFTKDNLPPEHISGDKITTVNYTDEYRGNAYQYEAGVTKTDTQTGVSQIEINRQAPAGSYDRPQMEQTLAHEVGHNVYHNMPAENQTAWDKLSNSSKPGEYVSDYAQTTPQEDFSESYASYALDPAKLNDVSPAKFDFMRTKVFNGRVYGA